MWCEGLNTDVKLSMILSHSNALLVYKTLRVLLCPLTAFTHLLAMQAHLEVELGHLHLQTGVACGPTQTMHLLGQLP